MLIILLNLFQPSLRWEEGSVWACDNYYDTLYFTSGDKVIKISPEMDTTAYTLPEKINGVNTKGLCNLFWSKHLLLIYPSDTLQFNSSILWSTYINDSLLVSLNNHGFNFILLYDSSLNKIDSIPIPVSFNYLLPVNDSIVFSCSGTNGIYVLNLITKTIIYIEDTPGYSLNANLFLNYLYVADREGGVSAYIINNDYSLSQVWNESGWVSWLSVDTSNAVLAISSSGIKIYDVSQPDMPILISQINTPSMTLTVGDSLLWNIHPYRSVDFYDISNPSIPNLNWSFWVTGFPNDFAQKDTLLFLGGGGSGCDVFRVSNDSIQFLSRYFTSINIKNLSIMDDTTLFLPEYYFWKGITSISFASPESLYVIKNFSIGARYITKKVINYFFVSTGDSLICFKYISPDSIEFVQYLPLFEGNHLVWENNLICVSGNDSLIYIIDVQNPYSPQVQSEIYTGHMVYNTDIKDTLLVTSEGSYGVKIWDISNPSSPSAIGSISGIDARRIMLWGKYLYISTHNGWLYVYSLIDPSNPSKVDSFFLDDYPAGLSQGKNMIFVGSANRGFWGLTTEGYDIFPPQPLEANPLCVLNGSFWTSEESVGVLINSEERLGNLYLKYYESPSGDYDTTFSKIYADTIYLRNLTQGIDTLYIWASDTAGNLDYRFHSFFVIGYDTSPPPSPSPLLPQDSGYAGDTINFIWHGVYDNLSGLKTYKFQLSSDSLFTNILTDTNIPDTSLQLFAINLPVETQLFWHVSSIDSALNNSPWSSMWSFSIDTTAPGVPDSIYVNNRNKVSPWTRNDTFTIQYFYSQQDFSGLNRVYLKQGTPPMSNSDTSASFNQNPFIYLFEQEGVETLYIWLSDSAGNSNYLNNSICIVRRDTSPPDSITTVQVLPEDWTIDSMFSVTWQNPSDLSGITGYYLKKFTPPVSPYDSSFSTEVESINITADFTGRIPLYLWCEDSAGNNSFTRPSLFYIKRDTSPPLPPPLILPDSGGKYNADEGLLWSVAIDSCSGVRFYILQVDTTEVFNSPILTDTIDTTFCIPLDIPGMCDIYWRVQAIDSAGNPSSWSSVWFFYNDNLAPYPPESILVNGRKTVSPWTSDSVFNITVFPSSLPSKGDTSQIKQVFVKAGSPPENDFDTTFTAGDLEFQYIFTGCGTESLWCWLQDGAGNVNSENHSIFIVRRDTVPPQAPTSISIYPYAWTNVDTFIMRIDYLEDLSGIASVFIKIENEPTSVTDTSFTSEPESIITFTVEKEGIIPVYIWLKDSAGLYSQYIHNEIYRDTTPPVLETLYYSDTLKENEDVIYSFSFSDTLSGLKEVQSILEFPDSFIYLTPYQKDSIWNLTFFSQFLFLGAIPQIRATDVAGNSTLLTAPVPYLLIKNNLTYNDNLGNPIKISFNQDTASGCFFSIPYPIDFTMGDFLKFNGISDTSGIFSIAGRRLLPLNPEDTLSPGYAYFLYLPDKENVTLKIPPGVFDLTDTTMDLKSGWNSIGITLPYQSHIESYSTTPTSYIVPWKYEGGWKIARKLQPLHGYLIFSNIDSIVNYRNLKAFLPDSPYVKISGYFKTFTDEDNFITHEDSHVTICPEKPFFDILSINGYSIVSSDFKTPEIFHIDFKGIPDSVIISSYGKLPGDAVVVTENRYWSLNEYPHIKLLNNKVTIYTGEHKSLLNILSDHYSIIVNYSTIIMGKLDLNLITNYPNLTIKVFDVCGRMITEKNVNPNNTVSLVLSHSGPFFICIFNNTQLIWKGKIVNLK